VPPAEIEPAPCVSGTSAPEVPKSLHIGAYPRVLLIAVVRCAAAKSLQSGHIHCPLAWWAA
jgi:hypothetical protein